MWFQGGYIAEGFEGCDICRPLGNHEIPFLKHLFGVLLGTLHY